MHESEIPAPVSDRSSIEKREPIRRRPAQGLETLLTEVVDLDAIPWLSTRDVIQESCEDESAGGSTTPSPPADELDDRAPLHEGMGTDRVGVPTSTGPGTRLQARNLMTPGPSHSSPRRDAGPSVIVQVDEPSASDPESTLPPQGTTEQLPLDRGRRLPVETRPERARAGHRPLAAAATVVFAAGAYALVSGLTQPRRATPAAGSSVPEFLRQASDAPGEPLPPSGLSVATAAPPPPEALTTGDTSLEMPSPELAQVLGKLEVLASAPPAPALLEPARGDGPTQHSSPAPEARRPEPPDQGVAAPTAGDSNSRKPSPGAEGDVPLPQAAPLPAPPRSSTVRASAGARRLTTYSYAEGELYRVSTAPLRVTDVVLEQGETLVSPPTAGDSARWVFSVVDAGLQDASRVHVFVKPLRPGLVTNLTLNTSRRSYFLELTSSSDGSYMPAVSWQYPRDVAARRRQQLEKAARERQSTTQIADLNALRFDYRIRVSRGKPDWTPTQVFDDGRKTFIRFPRPLRRAQSPLLFVLLSGTNEAKVVRYRIKHDLYVVERLIETAELRLPAPTESQVGGGDNASQEVVRITRRRVKPGAD